MNKINAVIVVIAAAVLLAGGSAQTGKPPAPTGQVGRYQLLSGEHELITADGTPILKKGVFRIDTVTGATSLYSNMLPAAGEPFINEWFPISEFGKTPATTPK